LGARENVSGETGGPVKSPVLRNLQEITGEALLFRVPVILCKPLNNLHKNMFLFAGPKNFLYFSC
jgi:hypothetical protein